MLTDEEREVLERWSRAAEVAAFGGAAGPDRVAGGGRVEQHRGGGQGWGEPGDGGEVAQAVPGASSRRAGRRAPAGGAPHDQRRRRRSGDRAHAGGDSPTDATHWSTRDLAKRVGMSPSSVGRIWQAFGLKPWLTDTFKLSDDPQFVDKVRDVVGLYMNPPDHAVVLCVDEKTSIQALDRTRPSLPMRPGQVERRTHDYVAPRRHRPVRGVERRHRPGRAPAPDHAIGPSSSSSSSTPSTPPSPTDLAVHVVLDNPRTHKTPAVHRLAAAPPPVHVPLHARPAQLAEPRRALVRRAHHASSCTLRPPIHRRAHRRPQRLDRSLERQPTPFVWHKTADEILDSLKKYLTNL